MDHGALTLGAARRAPVPDYPDGLLRHTLDAFRLDDEIDRAFLALRTSLRPSGGIARASDVASWLEARGSGNLMSLAGHIGHGELFSVDWNESFWLPLLQFQRRTLKVRPAIAQVLAELGGVFDGWALATWFVEPNSWLNARCPADLLDDDLPGVLQAAQADRFIANG